MGAAATILLPQTSRPGGSRPGRRALRGPLKFLCAMSCDAASAGAVLDIFRRHGFDAAAEVGEVRAGDARLSVR